MLDRDANANPTPAESQYAKIILKRMKVLNERPRSESNFQSECLELPCEGFEQLAFA